MQNILNNIKNRCLSEGQPALLSLTQEFDKETLEKFAFKVPNNIALANDLKEAIIIAKNNIFKFHKA
jgi:histidinol dehydrogenase